MNLITLYSKHRGGCVRCLYTQAIIRVSTYVHRPSPLPMFAHRLGASLTTLRRRSVLKAASEQRWVQEVLIRKVPDDQQFLDIRLAVLGNMEAGKSTLLGVLTQGELDNGRGRARLNLFRHLHEIQSGRTSSISHEIMGFTSQGEVGTAMIAHTIQ